MVDQVTALKKSSGDTLPLGGRAAETPALEKSGAIRRRRGAIEIIDARMLQVGDEKPSLLPRKTKSSAR